MADTNNPDVLQFTSEIVSAHIANNKCDSDNLPALIKSVFDALSTVGNAVAPAEPERVPAVPIKKSVFPDYLVCLNDGKRLKMLKRHLKTSYDLTPEGYRTMWNLPTDYPMVAPSYAHHRSELAKIIGLGRKKVAPDAEGRYIPVVPAVAKTPTRRKVLAEVTA